MIAVEGLIRDNKIITGEDISAYNGNTVIITILDNPRSARRQINLDKYVKRTERGQHVDEYIDEMRDNDRI